MLIHGLAEPAMPARVVVLGAGGFIGGTIARRLSADCVPTLALARSDLDLMGADAGRKLGDVLERADTVVFVSARAPCKDLPMLRENLVMAEAVCAALRRVPAAHVVYVSSDAVYRDSRGAINEASCAQPSSLHGVMHLAREVALREAFAGPLALVRPTLVYGLRDPHNGYGPNRFRRVAAAGREIVLFGEGEERRDHVDVDDVAELVRLIVLRRSAGVINAVSGDVGSFREIAEFVASEYPPAVPVRGSPRSGPMPHGGYRAFDDRAVREAFPGFQLKSWRVGLAAVHALERSKSTA